LGLVPLAQSISGDRQFSYLPSSLPSINMMTDIP
jgi:hypothetical protein